MIYILRCMQGFNWFRGILQWKELFDHVNHPLTPKNMKLGYHEIAGHYVTGTKTTSIWVHSFDFKSIYAELTKEWQYESATQIDCQKWVWQSHVKNTRCSHQSRPIRCPLAPAIQDLAALRRWIWSTLRQANKSPSDIQIVVLPNIQSRPVGHVRTKK
jgi:hypothetical protein